MFDIAQRVKHPQRVNELREKVGLEPMSEYVQFWNLTWNVQQHIDMTKEMEAKGVMGFYKEKKSHQLDIFLQLATYIMMKNPNQ